ncbi:MAG: tetratricopeptide repeat protein [Myxococcales bacterium]|nr:tetratricopeptide repeat protein [Myxococcales bacterium]
MTRLAPGLPALGLLLWLSAPARAEGGPPRGERAPRAAPAFDNALRLARMLDDQAVVARLLAERALARGASAAEVSEAVEAWEAAGEPERAAALLEQRLRAVPDDDESQIRLAELLTRSGQAARAVAVWEAFEARVGILTAAQADAFARVLVRVGRQADALRVLAEVRADAPADAHDYWDDLATIAWEEEAADLGLAADRALWSMGDHRHLLAAHLVTLAVEAGAADEAFGVALDDFRENGQAESLLQAAEIQGERGDWAGAKRTLALADAGKEPFAKSPDYWLLLSEVNERLGDREAARAAYRSLLGVDPDSAVARSALLWDAVERADLGALREYTDRWRAGAERQPALWAPLAVALDRLGRTRAAIAFYARVVGTPSADPLVLVDFGDALTRVGDDRLATRVRRYALSRLRGAAVAAARKSKPSADERTLAEDTAELVRDVAGPAAGERWFRAIVAARGAADRASDAFVAGYCLHDDRVECARRPLWRHGGDADAPWPGYRLQLALADEDPHALAAAAEGARGPAAGERVEALIALEREDAAGAAIAEGLERGELDEPDIWRRRLAEIAARHRPAVGAAASYGYIAGLDVYGAEATAAHDAGRWRLAYSLAGREMATRNGTLAFRNTVGEADAFALGRLDSPRGSTEAGAGLNVQAGSVMPRAALLAERLLTSATEVRARVSVDEKIDDTALLRLAGAQHRLELGLRQDIGPALYAQIDVDGREDHTRHFEHLGWDLAERAEVGYKIVRSQPEWDVGVAALASQRQNVGVLPGDVAPLVPRTQGGPDPSDVLPPSYELVSVVTHLTRGDFLHRYGTDRAALPRYDCSAGVGLLLPDLDGALELECSAGVLVTTMGYVSASILYEQGVFGIANQVNAQALIGFTQGF